MGLFSQSQEPVFLKKGSSASDRLAALEALMGRKSARKH